MTEVDKKLIDYISKFYFDTGFYPNYEEIAEGMGWNSKSTVAIHVQRLEKEGIIIRKEYCSSQYKLKDINIVEMAKELAEYKKFGYTPEELKLAQGFPRDYIIDFQRNGKPYPKSKQVARIGNSVVPIMAQKLVEANCPYLKVGERVPKLYINYDMPQLSFM